MVMSSDSLTVGMENGPCTVTFESESQINAHLRAFRRCVKSMTYIRCPLDGDFLLAFLRRGNFVQYEALKLLENFCRTHSILFTLDPHWTHSSLSGDPGLDAYLQSGFLVELGRIDSGVTMVLIRLHQDIQTHLQRTQLRRFVMLDFDRLLTEKWAQLHGFGVIHDLRGLSLKGVMREVYYRFASASVKKIENSFPLRGLYSVYCFEHAAMEVAYNACQVLTGTKEWPKVLFVQDDLTRAFKALPGLQKVMPTEYGGLNGSVVDLIGQHEARFREYYSKPQPWTTIEVAAYKAADHKPRLLAHHHFPLINR